MISRAGRWTQNRIHHPSQAKKMKCLFLYYFQLLMIGGAGHWTRTPSTSCLKPKKWNAHFWITFNFWWSAGLVDELESHLAPLSNQKNEVLIFGLCSTSDDWLGWSMDSNPIRHLSPAKEWNAHFWITFNFWWLAGLVDGLKPHPPPYLQPKKWNACFWITFNFWWLARLVDGLKPHLLPLSSQKNEMLIFGLCSTSDDWPGWSMDSNPSTILLQPKKWNAHFWIMFNFWWLAGLVNALETHPAPLSSQKNEMLVFGLLSISGDQPGWSIDSNPINHPSPTKKMKCSFLVYVQLLMIGRAGQWTQTDPHLQPLSRQKMKCSFLDYIQLLMIGRAGQWIQTPSANRLQPEKWNAYFWITFNFWWSARLVDGLKPHPPPLSSQRMKCSFLDYIQLLMISWAGQWTRIPSATPLQTKKWNAHFWITFNFWWLARLVDGLKPHLLPLSSQKNEMLIFVLRSTSDDQRGWLMNLNPICHPSPAKKMKCSFLDYIQLLMIGQVGRWTQTPSATPLQPKKWNAHFWIMFNFWWSAGQVNGLKTHPPPLSSQKNEMLVFGLLSTSDDWPGWSMDSKSIHNPSPAKKWNAHFWIMFNFWWPVGLVNGLESYLPPLSKQKNDMLIFVLHSTSDDWPGWSMDSNPICNLSPTKNMKCLFLDYVQLLMISQAGQKTQTASATSFQPTKWNARFCITFNLWWSAGLVNGLKPHLLPLSSHKNEMLIFGLFSISGDQPGWLMDSNPIHHPSPAKKCNAHFWITFNFWWSVRLVNGLEPHLPPLSNQKKWYAHFWIMFNFWWSVRLVDGLELHPLPFSSQKNEMLIFVYIQLLMIGHAGHWTQTPSTSYLKPKKMKCSFLDYV